MKRIIALLLILTLAAVFAACVGKRETSANQTDKRSDAAPQSAATSAPPDNGITVGGHDIVLDEELRHGDLRFKAPKKAEKAGYDQIFNIFYPADGGTLFTVSIVYFEGKDVDEVMAGSDHAFTAKTEGGVEYRFFEDEVDGGKRRNYVYRFNSDTYVISFISQFDTASLESAFLSNARFEAD